MGPRRLWLGDVWVVCLHQVRALVYSRVCWSLPIGHLVGSRGLAGGSRRGTSHLVAARVSAPRGVASGSVDARMVAVRWDARLLGRHCCLCAQRRWRCVLEATATTEVAHAARKARSASPDSWVSWLRGRPSGWPASAFLHIPITQHTRHGDSRAVARRRPARARQSHRPARGVSHGRPLALPALAR